MKWIHHQLIVLVLISLSFSKVAVSQDSLAFDISCEINKTFPILSISKAQLEKAKTIVDLNQYYERSWVKEYISVEISTTQDGKSKKAQSKDNRLTKEQKDNLIAADVGTDISVNIRYIPNNNFVQNDIKDNNFTFTIEPDQDAQFPDNQYEMKAYLEEKIMDEIATINFKQYQLTAIKFTIDESGTVINAHVFESSKDEKIDQILLEAICNMPTWKAAQYDNGTKVKQEFVFTIGDMNSCVVNLLNIRQ